MALSTPVLNRAHWDFPSAKHRDVEILLEECETALLQSPYAESISAETLQNMILEMSSGDYERLQQLVAVAKDSAEQFVEMFREQIKGPSDFDILVRQAQQQAQRQADTERDLKRYRQPNSNVS